MSVKIETYHVSIIILSICTFIMMVFVTRLIHKLYICKQSIHLMPFISTMTTVCMVSCFICGALDLYDHVMCYVYNIYLFDKSINARHIINNSVYVIILISLFALFIGRLYYTFSDTIYALSNYFVYFVYVLLITTSLICFISAELVYAVPNTKTILSPNVSVAIIIINDTTLNIMCIVLFFYKLRQISVPSASKQDYQMVTVLSDNDDAVSNKNTIDLDFHIQSYHDTINRMHSVLPPDPSQVEPVTEGPNQMNLINIILRHTLLSTTSIFFNQAWYFCLLYSRFMVTAKIEETKQYNDIIVVEVVTRAVYLVINCIVLYLNLNIHHWRYYRICKPCHLWCYHRCTSKEHSSPRDALRYQRML
eukprot:227004_1